jgi:hypothetical protein
LRASRGLAAIAIAGLVVAGCSSTSGTTGPPSPVATSSTTATTVSTSTTTSTTVAPARVEVAVIGDSLIASTSEEIAAAVQGEGYTVSVAGSPGVPLTDPFIQSHLADARGTPIIVIATATNDNFVNDETSLSSGQAAASSAYRSLVERTNSGLAGSCTVWVNMRTRVAGLYRPEQAPYTNAVLAGIVASNPDTRLVDWATISEPHDSSDWFYVDELHFNRFYKDSNGVTQQDDAHRVQPGADAYAAAIAQGVRSCA